MDIKIGDKFKCINSDAIYQHKLGENYEITRGLYEGYYVLTLNNQDSYVSPTFLKENFVKVSEMVDLMFFITTSIQHNKQLGENLKKKCIDYVIALELEKFKHEQTENIEPIMSKADKMFEELGFIKKEMLPRLVYYTSGDMEVGIDLLDKRYWHTNGDSICHRAHLAIHEKMKELGWINE